jgi:hypothetical protein
MPSAQKAATAILNIKPTVQSRLGAGGGRYSPTHNPARTRDPFSTSFVSKYSRVVIFTTSDDGRTLRSASYSHILSHVLSCSGGGTPEDVAIISSLDYDDAASLSCVCLCVLCIGGAAFLLLMPRRIFFVSDSSDRMHPLSSVMSCRIYIIWSPNLDIEFFMVLVLSSIFVCTILYRSRSLSISEV